MCLSVNDHAAGLAYSQLGYAVQHSQSRHVAASIVLIFAPMRIVDLPIGFGTSLTLTNAYYVMWYSTYWM